MLGIEGSKYFIQLWSGDTPIEDYKISPINGDLEGLGRISIFIGTKETLYPDALKLSKMLNDKGLNMILHLVITYSIFILFSHYQNVKSSLHN